MDWTEGSDDWLAYQEECRRDEAMQREHDTHDFDPDCVLCEEHAERLAEDAAADAAWVAAGEHDERL